MKAIVKFKDNGARRQKTIEVEPGEIPGYYNI